MNDLVNQNEAIGISPIIREHMLVAEKYASSGMVPSYFRGKPEDIFIVLQMGEALGINHYATALYEITPIKGKPTISAKLAMTLAYRSGAFKDRIVFRQEGDSWDNLVVYASVTLISGEKVEVNASIAMAKAEGWTSNPKYKSMPVQMLSYRAALMLIRRYAPESLLGVPIVDVEAREVKSEPFKLVGRPSEDIEDLLGLEGEGK
ncbi:MAG: hypothetical protein HRU19_29955 [Pseudobacteriovorax sp.]|nr:hypothetical protein [Pseudobacteriovorax sp.]